VKRIYKNTLYIISEKCRNVNIFIGITILENLPYHNGNTPSEMISKGV